MKNLLLGITGSPNSYKRLFTTLIREELVLRHYSMQHPAERACAAILGIDHHDYCVSDKSRKVDFLSITQRDLQRRVTNTLRLANQRYFIDIIAKKFKADAKTSQLFKGAIVSGIQTEAEARWLRNKGGILIHLHNAANLGDRDLVRTQHGDLMFIVDNKEHVANAVLRACVLCINQKLKAA